MRGKLVSGWEKQKKPRARLPLREEGDCAGGRDIQHGIGGGEFFGGE